MGKHSGGEWRAGRSDMLSEINDGEGFYKAVYVDDPDAEMYLGEKVPALVARAYGALGADPRDNARLLAVAPKMLDVLERLCASHKRFSGGIWDEAREVIDLATRSK